MRDGVFLKAPDSIAALHVLVGVICSRAWMTDRGTVGTLHEEDLIADLTLYFLLQAYTHMLLSYMPAQ